MSAKRIIGNADRAVIFILSVEAISLVAGPNFRIEYVTVEPFLETQKFTVGKNILSPNPRSSFIS
jgi:hypothetical protein